VSQAEEDQKGTFLALEDLSSWDPGADPVGATAVLARLHGQWEGTHSGSLARCDDARRLHASGSSRW